MPADRLRSIVISAAMAALALVLPPLFHVFGLGSKFLPMLLALLMNGFLVRFRWAVFTGLAVPWISALATGMPPLYPPVAAVVSAEGAVLGGVASLLYRHGRGNAWVALLTAVFCGRATMFTLTSLLAGRFSLPPAVAAISLAQGLPGVALQLAVVPLVLRLLARSQGQLFMKDMRA